MFGGKKKAEFDYFSELPENRDKKAYRPNHVLVPFSIIIAGALIAGAIVYNGRFATDSAALASTSTTVTPTIGSNGVSTTTVSVSLQDGHEEGNKNAKVAIVEFSDYECPYCQSFFQNSLPSIESAYIKTNKVLHIFKDYPLSSIHPYALVGAEAAWCAGEQGKYWQMHDTIYSTNQSQNDQTKLESDAASLGLNTSQFNACVQNNKYSNQIQTDVNDGNKIGVQGTPTVLIGTYNARNNTVTGNLVYGAYPYATFQTLLDQYLKKA